MTGVLALTVAGIAAAGPAHDSHAAAGRPTATTASTTAERDSATGAAPGSRTATTAGRLVGLRTGIHPAIPGAEVHDGPARAARAAHRTARRAAPRTAKTAPAPARTAPRRAEARTARPSMTRRTGTYQKQRLIKRVRTEVRRHDGERSRRFRDVRDRKAGKHRPVKRYTGDAGRVVEYALDQVGKPYRRNAAGPGSYDCSGLVSVAYRKAGVKLPHSSHGIARKGKKVRRADLRPGDVVLPQSGHVGIYLGDGKMVHAATPRKGVVVSKMYGFSTARRLL
ncbi:C40 family peptidase [Catenuloplanes atrovinosus]|uniref:C40 family peptidase n=1 Tax=Catenuloplanes atrovinosus TaxID=137266 RepID=UPI00286CAEB4|nr:C40 family peptidase [Catenuloplanes atrovinosus]